MTITVTQFGLSPASGALADIVDENAGTGWAPLPDDLSAYTAPFLTDSGQPNSGGSFAGFQFDFGENTRVPMLLLQTESVGTLSRAMVVASNNPATSVSNMVQVGDVLLGVYSQAEMNAGLILKTAAASEDIRTRYLRICMRTSRDDIPDTSDPGYVDPTVASQIDSGAGLFIVPSYTGDFTIEIWGGGASGGLSSEANSGTATTIQIDDSQMEPGHSGWSMTANGGVKSASASPNAGPGGVGGTASGGDTNLTGGSGGIPDPGTTAFGWTGKGGDSPNGGAGGISVLSASVGMTGSTLSFGRDGNAPGGGGGGKGQLVPLGDLLSYKFPGGGAGGYSKKTRGRFTGGPPPGAIVVYSVGVGGAANNGQGKGAAGRVKFSFT